LMAKVTLALRRTKLAECADAMNINWLQSHSAPPRRLAEFAAIFCATSSLPPFVRYAVVNRYRADGSERAGPLEECQTIRTKGTSRGYSQTAQWPACRGNATDSCP
jgi:hypothetical protein